jgi:hypothetical protein
LWHIIGLLKSEVPVKVLIISLTPPVVNPEHSQRVYPELVEGLTFYSSAVIFAFNRDIMGRKENAGERFH